MPSYASSVELLCLLLAVFGSFTVTSVHANNNARCQTQDRQFILGQLSATSPNADSRVTCSGGSLATSCQCDATQNKCNGAWFSETDQCTALNSPTNAVGTRANVTCTTFSCDDTYRVEVETLTNQDSSNPTVTCPDWTALIGCSMKDTSSQGNSNYGQGVITGNTCQYGPCADAIAMCSVHARCQAVYQCVFLDAAVDERCTDYIIISWLLDGDPIYVPGYKITILPATVEGETEIILRGSVLVDLYDPITGRMVYNITTIEPGVSYEISIYLMDDYGGVTDKVTVISDDLCVNASNPCQNGGTCCDDGTDYICHCTEEYTGTNCQDIADPCDPNPCQNGGLCISLNPGFICSCPVGYGGIYCEELVLVPVDTGEVEVVPRCTSAVVSWQASGVGLEPDSYEVRGNVLGNSNQIVLCGCQHPETSCLATNLVRTSTYIYSIASIAGVQEEETPALTFSTTDTPAFTTCPSDPDSVFADGVDEARVWWDEPEAECLGPTTIGTSSHQPGDYFPIGTTTVTYTLIDMAVVVDTCQFDVVVEERGVCTAYGDPHYISFNNENYDFQGVCTYVLVATSQFVSPEFNVTVLNKPMETNPFYSNTKEVNVTIYDTLISLLEGGSVTLDGILVNLPANVPPDVTVFRSGCKVVVQSGFGLYVSYDGYHQVDAKVPANPYKFNVGGLCGNYGNSGFIKPGGDEADDVNEFGDSWASREGCKSTNTTNPICPTSYGVNECGIIIDPTGPFAVCHSTVPPDSYYASCLYDYCATDEFCPAIEAYDRACAENGVQVGDWREGDFCPLECVVGMDYLKCGPGCMDTCVYPDASKHCPIRDCVEGCFCPNGTVVDGDRCVDPAHCGCKHKGRYYSIGDVVIDPKCSEICNCTDSREMVCRPVECDENASCLINGGRQKCVCDEPYYEGNGRRCNRKCSDPGSPENGGQNEDHVYPVSNGVEVTYYCDSGYLLYDPNSLACIDSSETVCEYGSWSDPVPDCKMGCTDPGTPDQGQQIGDNQYPVCTGTEVYFECEDLHELLGSPSTTCEEGVWSDPIPSCQPMCDDPGSPENGHQDGNYSYPASEGTRVGFTCDAGYSLYDEESQMCIGSYTTECVNGNWTDPLPTCQAMCGDPGQPDNGRQVNPPTYPVCEGTAVEFACDVNYEMIGSETSVCQDGAWTVPVPECRITCQDPGSPANGGQVGDPAYPVSDGTVVEYHCNAGYSLIDPVDDSCLTAYSSQCLNGSWSDPTPLCLAECGDPGTPSDGAQLGSVTYPVCSGTSVAFECDVGHELHGEDVITCTDGDWSSPIPSCNPTCEDPGHPNNGYQLGANDYPVNDGYVVHFDCNDGYELFDPQLMKCIQEANTTCEDGTWSDPLPLCKRLCDDPGCPDNGSQTEEQSYPVCSGTVVEFSCDEGFSMNGTTSTVCHDGSWSNPTPTCVAVCNDPGDPENGYQVSPPDYPTQEGTEVSFECDAGYSLHDPDAYSCEDSWSTVCTGGSWTNPLPICKLECSDPGTPDFGYQDGTYSYPVCSGTTVTFGCDAGYSLTGLSSLTCVDGQWDDELPTCAPSCSDPGEPTNGHQIGFHDYPVSDETVVYFDCNGGYALHDSLTGECLKNASATCNDGLWSDPLPECHLTCDNPGYPRDGRQVEELCFPVCSGTNLTFECHDDHALVGDKTTTCVEGQWTNPVPKCEPLCSDPGTPENGQQEEDHSYPVIDGTEVSFTCNDRYRLHDPASGNCTDSYSTVCSDHSWTKPLPACLGECDDPGTPSGGEPEGSYVYPVCSGTSVSYSCQDDYFLSGEPTLTCEDGVWNNPLPSCQPGCPDPGAPENGHQLDSYVYPVQPGTVVRYCCDDNYVLQGSQAILCQDDGTWDEPLPVCEPLCTDPGAPANGFQVDVVEYPADTNTTVHYDCKLGYEMHGKGYSVCEHGSWIPPVEDTYCAEIEECCSDPCQNNGVCIEGVGRYDCLCQPGFEGINCEKEYGVCYVWGDPHYVTYDGEKYDFQGDCVYILTESAIYGMTSFRVLANNQAFETGGETLSMTQEIALIVYGQEIRLMRNGEVRVDGSLVVLPHEVSPKIQVRQTGNYVSIFVDFGLVVRWDGYHYGDVKVPESYKGLVRGLCGNYNGDLADEFMDPEGRIIPTEMEHTHRAAMFGNTWVANSEVCDSEAGGCNPCATDIDVATQAHSLCSLITDEDGPFAACHATVVPEDYFGACMFDLCAKLPDEEGLCMNAEAYAQACLDNFIPIDWRSDVFCPYICDADKVYNISTSACPSTCADQRPYYQCPEGRLVDGCVCPQGQVVGTSGECVSADQCPCEYQGQVIEFGDSIIKEECDEQCTCMEGGHVECVAIRCDVNAFCGEVNGEHGCHCDDGFTGNGFQCNGQICQSNPCLNGGVCQDHGTHYTCTCLPGYEGVNCENEIYPCDSDPCENGVCVNEADGYTCECTSGFYGQNCEQRHFCYSCLNARNNDDCNENTDGCLVDQPACETKLRNVSGDILLSKGCILEEECRLAENANDAGCDSGQIDESDVCHYCCHGDLCNEDVPNGFCLRDGVLYVNGSSWSEDNGSGCQDCECNSGTITCVDVQSATYYNGQRLCTVTSDCGADSTCEQEDVDCVGDDCIKLCTGGDASRHSSQEACAPETNNNCVTIDIGVQSAPTIPVICEDLTNYIITNVPSVSQCSDFDCEDPNFVSRRRRRDTQTTFRIVIEQRTPIDEETDIVHDIKEAINRDRNAGKLASSLNGINQVEVETELDEAEDESGTSSWLLPTLVAIVAVATIVVIVAILYRRSRRYRVHRDSFSSSRGSADDYNLGPYSDGKTTSADNTELDGPSSCTSYSNEAYEPDQSGHGF